MEKSSKTKVVFFGTAGFAVPVLDALSKNGYDLVTVVTQPDKPTGRKQILTPPPMKLAAQKFDIDVWQPKNLKIENLNLIENWKLKIGNCALGIVAAYGKLIPPEIFNLPKHGIIVVHPSLLPKYRGPSPVQTAILNGDEETGVTIMKIDEELDHGPILTSSKFKVQSSKKYTEINDEIWQLGAELLIKTLPDYLSGKIKPQPQDHSRATFCKKITKEDGRVDWHNEAKRIYNQFRAYYEWPGIWTTWNNKILKIADCEIIANQPYHGHDEYYIGRVHKEEGRVYIPCKNGHLDLLRLQLEGGKEMSAEEFLRGHPNFIGSVLQ